MNTGKAFENLKPTTLLSAIEIQDRALKLYEKAIYENIGQALSLAKMNLFTVDLARPAELRRKINFSKKLISRAIQDLRQMTKQPGPDAVLKKGFVFALEQEIERIRHYQQVNLSFEFDGNSYRLDAERELAIYLLLQEFILSLVFQQVIPLVIKVQFYPTKIHVSLCHQIISGNERKLPPAGALLKESLAIINAHSQTRIREQQWQTRISIDRKPVAGSKQ